MSRHEELLEYLARKGCAMSRSRIREDLRWPEQELDAVIGALMRAPAKIRAPRPGEYELVPARLPNDRADTKPIPAATEALLATAVRPSESRAMETIVAHRQTEEMTMAKKQTCTKCGVPKGATGFPRGSDAGICRLCLKGGGAKKPQGGVRPSGNGASLAAIATKHAGRNPFTDTVSLLRAEAAKFTAAADALEALGT